MKTLSKLTYRYLKLNKRKSLITLISITLVVILIFSVGLGASAIRKNTIDNILKNNGSHHIELYDLPFSTIDTLKNNSDIKDIALMQQIKSLNQNSWQINVVNITPNLANYFQNLQGSFPQNNTEIIISAKLAKTANIKIGDTLNNQKIVGVFTKTPLNNESYNSSTYYIYTLDKFNSNSQTTFFLTFKSVNNAYAKIAKIADNLSLKSEISYGNIYYENAIINTSLLNANGEYYLIGTSLGIYLLFSLILVIICIFCILIVRNSFTISLSERQKQFGSLRSIGASKKQIFKMVMIEASMLSLIAIPLGIILSTSLVSSVLAVFNKILSGINSPYQLFLYPNFIIISLLFILITIYGSAYYPAYKASKVRPIEAVKGTNIYKIKKSKENYPLIKRIFKAEGEVAYKNMKRNRRKFTSSTISLCIAIILFISFATLIDFVLANYQANYDDTYDIIIDIPRNSPDIIEKITNISSIDDLVIYKNDFLYFENNEFLTSKYLKEKSNNSYNTLILYGIDNNTYQKFLNKLGIKNDYFGIVINKAYYLDEDTNEKIYYEAFKSNANIVLNLNTYEVIYNQETNVNEEVINSSYLTIDNLYLADDFPYLDLFYPTLIVDFETFDYLEKNNPKSLNSEYTININSNNYKLFDEEMNKIIAENPNVNINYSNFALNNYNFKMESISFAFIVYTVLIFIALISITTVFSSVSANIQTRERDFSILRSIGMSKKGLNKMLILEGVFLGLKVLLFSIPISLIIVSFIREALKLMNIMSKTTIYPYPTTYIISSIVGVLLLIFLVTIFSIRKIKKKNIIDSIKNENI